MARGITEFTTKFAERVEVSPVVAAGHWYVTISVSDGTDPDPDEYRTIDLCRADARDLAIALYHAVCRMEEEAGL